VDIVKRKSKSPAMKEVRSKLGKMGGGRTVREGVDQGKGLNKEE